MLLTSECSDFFFYSRWLLLFVAILSATVIFDIVTEVCIRACTRTCLCLVGVFYSEIHSFSIFCAFKVYFLHLSGTFSEQYIRTVPWTVLNDGQNNFILFVYSCRIFFFAFVVLTEHCSGCPHTQNSSVTFQ